MAWGTGLTVTSMESTCMVFFATVSPSVPSQVQSRGPTSPSQTSALELCRWLSEWVLVGAPGTAEAEDFVKLLHGPSACA